MSDQSWKSPTQILSFIMVLLTAVSVWTSIRATNANRDAVEMMKQQILADTRPYVIADFVEKEDGIYFELSNRGNTAAHNVVLSFSNVLRAQIENHSFPSKLATRPISFMSPGTTYRELLIKLSKNQGLTTSKHPLSIVYHDAAGNRYEEKSVLTVLGTIDSAE